MSDSNQPKLVGVPDYKITEVIAMEKLTSDIKHIKITLDSLAFSLYKHTARVERIIYMTKKEIDEQYPHVKDIQEPGKEEPIFLSKGKFKIECGNCGKESVSTGIISMNGDIKYRQYQCDYCHAIENEMIKDETE